MNASSAVLVSRPSNEIIDLLKKEHTGGIITGRMEVLEQIVPGHIDVLQEEIKRRLDEEENDENTEA